MEAICDSGLTFGASLSCRVKLDVRNRVLNFSILTSFFSQKLSSQAVTKHLLLPLQQLRYDLNDWHFCTSLMGTYFHVNLSSGSKFFISNFVWFLQRIALKSLARVNAQFKDWTKVWLFLPQYFRIRGDKLGDYGNNNTELRIYWAVQ